MMTTRCVFILKSPHFSLRVTVKDEVRNTELTRYMHFKGYANLILTIKNYGISIG